MSINIHSIEEWIKKMWIYMYIYIYIHTHTHTLVCFCILALANNAAGNMDVQMPFQDWFQFFVYIPRSGTAGLYDNSV